MNDSALTLPARAAIALRSAEREAKLVELAKASASIMTITNPDGYSQCHSARMALKTTRINIEKDSKIARDDAVAFNKATLAEEHRLVGLIEPEETRLENLQKAWDAAREAEKQARIEAELKRVTDLQEHIAELRGNLMLTPSIGSALIAKHISDLQSVVVDASFEEFYQQALDAKDAGLKRLQDLHAAALALEAEQERIQAEREELARLRAEAQQREATERARIAEEERKAKAERDAESARQAEQLRQQREEESRLAAERQAIIDAENARIRAEQAAAQAEIDRQAREQAAAQAAEQERLRQERAEIERAQRAEADRLATERAAFEAQQAEARWQQEEAQRQQAEGARLAAIKKPADAELIKVLADHYRVPANKVREWLRAMKLTQIEAA